MACSAVAQISSSDSPRAQSIWISSSRFLIDSALLVLRQCVNNTLSRINFVAPSVFPLEGLDEGIDRVSEVQFPIEADFDALSVLDVPYGAFPFGCIPNDAGLLRARRILGGFDTTAFRHEFLLGGIRFR